ncbi:stress-inducible protein, partial [Chrysochromulina tobinii]
MFGFGPRTPGSVFAPGSGFVFTGLAGHDGSFSFEREADGIRHRREHTSRTEHIHQEEHWRRAQEAQREEMRRAQQQVQRQFEQARQRCAQKASEAAEPTRADQLRQRGNQAFAAGRYAKAVTQYSAALKAMAPTRNPRLLSNRSASYAKLERFEEAYKDAVECAKLSPDWDKAHGRLGMALAGLGKHEAAAEAFDQAAAACIASAELHGQTGVSDSEGAQLAAEVAKAAGEWRERARQQRVQAETEAQREREKAQAEAAAVAKRRDETRRREVQIEIRKAEVEHELRHAVDEGLARIEELQRRSAGDSAGGGSVQLPLVLVAIEEQEEVIKRVLTSAQRVGVCKEVQAHAKGALKRLLCAREDERRRSEESEAARIAAAELQAVLDDEECTRSRLKAAIRRAETVGVEAKVDKGAALLTTARELLAALGKEAKTKPKAAPKAAGTASAHAAGSEHEQIVTLGVQQMVEMGFSAPAARTALERVHGDVVAALEMLTTAPQ